MANLKRPHLGLQVVPSKKYGGLQLLHRMMPEPKHALHLSSQSAHCFSLFKNWFASQPSSPSSKVVLGAVVSVSVVVVVSVLVVVVMVTLVALVALVSLVALVALLVSVVSVVLVASVVVVASPRSAVAVVVVTSSK